MVIKRRSGESFESYQERYHQQSAGLETLYTQCKVLDALISVDRDCYSDKPWYWEGNKLKNIMAREVVETCRALLALWSLVPPRSEEEKPDALPF